MESTDVGKMMNVRKLKSRKPYVAPKLRRLIPAEATSLVSRRRDDTSAKELQQLMESVNQFHGAKGS
ncbi:MAG: hypothetical protein ACRD3P_16370 [Terriglobales bacterium]